MEIKNKRQIFAVLLSIIVPVFLVSLGVYAATTIGENIETAGTLDVTGASTFTGLATFDQATSTSATTTAYLYVGPDFSEDANMNFTAGDLYVANDVNVGGVTYLDGVLQATTTSLFTGAATFYDKVKVGEGDWGTGDTGILLDGTDPDWAFEIGARVNAADITGGAYSGNYTAMTITADQTNSSFLGSWNELYITGDSIDMTNADNFGAVWGNLEISGSSVISTGSDDWMAAIHGSITTPSGYTNNTVMAGVQVDSNVNSTLTNNLRFSAFECDKVSGSRDWDYGLYMRDITTGINIATSTTGIAFTGDMTTGISVGDNKVIPQLLTVGSSAANGMEWDGTDENIMIYAEMLDASPGSKTFAKIHLTASSTAATSGTRIEGFRTTISSSGTNDVTADMRAVVGQVEFGGDMTYTGSTGSDFAGAYAVIASVWSGSNVTATGNIYPLGIFFGLETGTSLNGESAYIYIYNYGKVAPESVMKIYTPSQPGVPTYFIDREATLGSYSDPIYSGDIDPAHAPDGDSIGATGYIKIRVGSTDYYIPIYAALEP